MNAIVPIKRLRTAMLDLAYEEHGDPAGEAVILLHGFPYDPRAYDAMAPVLAGRGYRVIVPYLRGYGPTRFADAAIPRSGQQAILAQDLRDFMDGLGIARAGLAGYDWGGRAACIVAALWPERVSCLVSGDGYNIQDIAGFAIPRDPETEHRYWYQYYFHTPRGEAGLAANRRDLARRLWRLRSPSWRFDHATFAASAASFDNPDFVAVVIHSYRHRYGYAAGDPAVEEIERALASQPAISVPTISLCGGDDGVGPPSIEDTDRRHFTGRYERRVLPGIGHNIPQEAPEATAAALLELLRGN
jgi:pimeloyl-ACP methyl ester carboxylesterase